MRGTTAVVSAADGFAVQRFGFDPVPVRWNDVVQVHAFLRDEITVDTVCVVVRLRDGREVLLDEEMRGWEGWLGAASAALPGTLPREAWWPAVTRPPFCSRALVLFEREPSPSPVQPPAAWNPGDA